MKTYGHFIDGAYVEPLKGKLIDSFNPYSGEVWARIPQGCADDVNVRSPPRTERCAKVHGPR